MWFLHQMDIQEVLNKGFEITIDESIKDKVFLAGAKLEDEILKTSGGRVLSVVGFGTTDRRSKKKCI